MLEISNILYGISSFVITGIDDLFLLILLNTQYPKYIFKIFLGYILGLSLVVFQSYMISVYTIDVFINFEYIKTLTKVLIIVVLLYIGFNFINQKVDDNEDNLTKYIKHNDIKIIFISTWLYYIQGWDDTLIYYTFFINFGHELIHYLYYITGVFIGLFFFFLISYNLKKISKKLNIKLNNKNKKWFIITLLFLFIITILFGLG